MGHDGAGGAYRNAANGQIVGQPGRDGGGGGDGGHGGGRGVLIIEDESSISEAIRFILRRDGWGAVIHATGSGALEAIAALRPSLVILDVMLPGLSGFEILQALRAQPATAALPVILLTAKGSSAARDMARAAGASMFMAKPFANADLLAAVRQLVGARTP